jgi:hypothetical protein
MLRYRALLVDTENSYQRPVQTFCNSPMEVASWAKANLRSAGKHAYVTVYAVAESEIGSFKKSDYDQGATPSLEFFSQKASQPA